MVARAGILRVRPVQSAPRYPLAGIDGIEQFDRHPPPKL